MGSVLLLKTKLTAINCLMILILIMILFFYYFCRRVNSWNHVYVKRINKMRDIFRRILCSGGSEMYAVPSILRTVFLLFKLTAINCWSGFKVRANTLQDRYLYLYLFPCVLKVSNFLKFTTYWGKYSEDTQKLGRIPHWSG